MEVSIGPGALKSLSSSEKLEDVTLCDVSLSSDDLFDLARVRSLKGLHWNNGTDVTITDDSLDWARPDALVGGSGSHGCKNHARGEDPSEEDAPSLRRY